LWCVECLTHGLPQSFPQILSQKFSTADIVVRVKGAASLVIHKRDAIASVPYGTTNVVVLEPLLFSGAGMTSSDRRVI